MISFVRGAWLVAVAAVAYFAAYQVQRSARFDIGERDESYLGDPDEFYPALRMKGPLRHPDGHVEVIESWGRLTRRRASLELPYHLLGSPVTLRVRCHRFGLGGSVHLVVNGASVGAFEFGETSYPWGGISAKVPAEVARKGPLEIVLLTSQGRPSPSHLPKDMGVGLDWIEAKADSRRSLLLPTARQWAELMAFAVLSLLFLRAIGLALRAGELVTLGLVGLLCGALVLLPRHTAVVIPQLWKLIAVAILTAYGFAWIARRNREAALRLATLAVSSLLGLAVLELGLRAWERRLAHQQQAAPEALALLHPNPHGTGSYRLKPNLSLTTRVGRTNVLIQTNSHGMRWREVPLEASQGRERVAFLGDSFTFGCWTDVVETSLVGVFETRVGPRGFEALNFGVGGYGLADEELMLQEEAIRFGPRYVIVVMFNGNDFRDTFLGLHKETLVEGAAVLDEENLKRKVRDVYVRKDLTASAASPESAGMRRLRGFATFRFLAPFLRLENLSREFAVNTQFTSYSFWSHHPYPPVAREAKDASLATLERMAGFAAARGIRFGVVAVPTRDQVYARETAGEEFDVDFPQADVRIWARERGVPFLDLLPELRARVQKTNEDLYVKGETHLNEAGHRITGERIADWFLCCVAE